MKKYLLLFFTLFFYFFSYSQNLSLSYENGNLTSGDTINVYVVNNYAHEQHIYVANNSASSIVVKVKKDSIGYMEGTFLTFCWGVCYSPTVIVSLESIPIAAGQTNYYDFYADFNANGLDGEMLVRYTFFDLNNESDSAYIYINYKSSPVSVPEVIVVEASISNPYPNPASNKCQFAYTLPQSVNDAKIIIMDLAGNIVLSSQLNKEDTKKLIDVSSLSSGIYFYSMWIDEKPFVTRKLIVQK